MLDVKPADRRVGGRAPAERAEDVDLEEVALDEQRARGPAPTVGMKMLEGRVGASARERVSDRRELCELGRELRLDDDVGFPGAVQGGPMFAFVPCRPEGNRPPVVSVPP